MELMFQNSHRRLLDVADGGISPPENGYGEINSSNTISDINMVIILAALFCALIGALIVNSILQYCFVRWRRHRRRSSSGVKSGDLVQIPVTVYGADEGFGNTECAICLGEFENGDGVRKLPKCHHGFHVKCIDAWLASHSSCPNCRRSLIGPITNADNGGAAAEMPGNESGYSQGNVIILIAAI